MRTTAEPVITTPVTVGKGSGRRHGIPPVANEARLRPTYTHREIDYRAIVLSLAVTGKQFEQFEARESITRRP